MDILYRRGRATAAEVREGLPNRPSYSAVRAMLRILEEKGHVKHKEESLRYMFVPTLPREKAKHSALQHLLESFFEGSAERAVAALLDGSAAKLSEEELHRLSRLIDKAKSQREKK